MSNILSTSVQIGTYHLRNKIVMAPLTRMRADGNFAPTELNVEYYRQRATAGLIITEGSQITQQGQGYPNTPGIYSKEQIAGWRKVTEAIHKEDGLVFLQLWHVGRVSHSSYQPGSNLPVAPTSLSALGNAVLSDFSKTLYEVPKALTISEIKQIVENYRQAAINAKEAGFDGVEIHGANGYLIEQFLRTVSNHRTDSYGGSIANRARLLFETLEAVLTVWTNDKVAVRLSPFYTGSILEEPAPYSLYDYVVKRLADYQLAYLHIIELGQQDVPFNIDQLYIKHINGIYNYPVIAAGGFNSQNAEIVIREGYASAIAFGRHYISTPDLAYRLINGIKPNELDRSTIYGGGSRGYTDYEFYKEY